MKGIMQKVADEQDFVIENMEVADNHVNLMVTFKPKYAIKYLFVKFRLPVD